MQSIKGVEVDESNPSPGLYRFNKPPCLDMAYAEGDEVMQWVMLVDYINSSVVVPIVWGWSSERIVETLENELLDCYENGCEAVKRRCPLDRGRRKEMGETQFLYQAFYNEHQFLYFVFDPKRGGEKDRLRIGFIIHARLVHNHGSCSYC